MEFSENPFEMGDIPNESHPFKAWLNRRFFSEEVLVGARFESQGITGPPLSERHISR